MCASSYKRGINDMPVEYSRIVQVRYFTWINERRRSVTTMFKRFAKKLANNNKMLQN